MPNNMLLTITTTHQPATDLGYLLHKNPDKLQTFDLTCGQAQVFYPVATPEICTAALVLDINSVELARGKTGSQPKTLGDYVSDRPYVASSFLSVALAQVFRSALSGQCRDRSELAETAIPLVAKIPVLPTRGRESFLRDLFAPLGYEIEVERLPLDTQFTEWGNSSYFDLTLRHTLKLQQLLSHLYVLIPVLDDTKHYFVNDEEISKLLRHGKDWLAEHPLKAEITNRYLKRQRALTRDALALLAPEEVEVIEVTVPEVTEEIPRSLNEQRLDTVVQVLKSRGVQRVIDLGCGEGRLLRRLAAEAQFTEILGMDVTYRAIEIAKERVLDRLPIHQQQRLQLIQGSLTYRDDRLNGYDAATVIEVIEHMELDRLTTFARVLFSAARPKLVVLTTPNVEYNVNYPGLANGNLRHLDHRFEWTRAEFETWGRSIGEKYSYGVEFSSIGDLDAIVGSPTQMAIFTLINTK
jgi:3' terminal RNA ribose 2'-O-methyltransferase Hen1